MKLVDDKQEKNVSDLVDILADQFELDDNQRTRLPPKSGSSSRQTSWEKLVRFARTDLKRAGLLEDPRLNHTQITQRGVDHLSQNPTAIIETDLKKYPEYLDKSNDNETTTTEEIIDPTDLTERALVENTAKFTKVILCIFRVISVRKN